MINCVTIVGRLTKDIELSKAASGTTIGRFSLANNRWTPNGDQTTFVNCTAFGKTADSMASFTRKGMLVGVVGRLQSSSYTGKDGVKRTSMDVIANEVHFLERKSEAKVEQHNDEFGESLGITEEDLPF